MRHRKSDIKSKSLAPVTIKAVWYDHFANIWFEYPRRFKGDSTSTPQIALRGSWLADAGYSIGQKLDVEVSAQGILLKAQRRE